METEVKLTSIHAVTCHNCRIFIIFTFHRRYISGLGKNEL
jgi:hypothetical protein